MGYRSGLRFFKPIIKNLFKTGYNAKQWGLLLVYLTFFILFTIIELFCLLFTGKTVSTGFKYYAKKDPHKAKEVVEALVDTFDNVKEHFFKRLENKNEKNNT